MSADLNMVLSAATVVRGLQLLQETRKKLTLQARACRCIRLAVSGIDGLFIRTRRTETVVVPRLQAVQKVSMLNAAHLLLFVTWMRSIDFRNVVFLDETGMDVFSAQCAHGRRATPFLFCVALSRSLGLRACT